MVGREQGCMVFTGIDSSILMYLRDVEGLIRGLEWN
jgi:hypothetical protein